MRRFVLESHLLLMRESGRQDRSRDQRGGWFEDAAVLVLEKEEVTSRGLWWLLEAGKGKGASFPL